MKKTEQARKDQHFFGVEMNYCCTQPALETDRKILRVLFEA